MKDFLVISLWIIFGLTAAYYARNRGRSPYTWFFVGLIFGVLGLLLLFILPNRVRVAKMQSPEEPASAPAQLALSPIEPPKPSPLFWYYLDGNNQQFGPMSYKALQEAAEDGKIHNKTFVWHEKLSNWKPYEEILKEI